MENLLLGVPFQEAWRAHEELGEEFGSHQNRSTAFGGRLHGDGQPTKQSTSTLSWWGRNTRRSGGNLQGKDVAVAKKFDAHQLRLSSRHLHLAKMGFEETHKVEDDRTSRFL